MLCCKTQKNFTPKRLQCGEKNDLADHAVCPTDGDAWMQRCPQRADHVPRPTGGPRGAENGLLSHDAVRTTNLLSVGSVGFEQKKQGRYKKRIRSLPLPRLSPRKRIEANEEGGRLGACKNMPARTFQKTPGRERLSWPSLETQTTLGYPVHPFYCKKSNKKYHTGRLSLCLPIDA